MRSQGQRQANECPRPSNAVAIVIALFIGMSLTPFVARARQASVTVQVFYDELSRYGTWVEYPNYGYVWIPDSKPGFRPYATAGRWVFTDDGWTWVSDYPWGWATFHYGRWDYDNVYGWFWVPGTEWGPAWVSWRRAPGYYGWTPLRPGISFAMAFGRDYHERNERWIFVRDKDMTRTNIGQHVVVRTSNALLVRRSTVIVNTRNDDNRNVTYMTGPERDDVQRVTHTTVTAVPVRESTQPGHYLGHGVLQTYRPQFQRRTSGGRMPVPERVMTLREVRPASVTNAARPSSGPVDHPTIVNVKELQAQTGVRSRTESLSGLSRPGSGGDHEGRRRPD